MTPLILNAPIRRQAPFVGLAALLCLLAAPCHAAFRPGALVLPFNNSSVYSGHLLGRRAADQLALDLGATGAWRVVDRAQADRAAEQRDLRPPYAVAYLQDLGHALGGDVIFSGAIQKLEVDPKLAKITVTIYVEGTDQVSGQSVLGTLQTGEARANAAAPEPTDVLIGRALADATAKAAAAAAKGTGVTGTISEPGDAKTVTLKLAPGAQAATGMRFLLYRAGLEGDQPTPTKLIATLMVTKTSADSATANVLARSGDIHTGDIAVSICSPTKAE